MNSADSRMGVVTEEVELELRATSIFALRVNGRCHQMTIRISNRSLYPLANQTAGRSM